MMDPELQTHIIKISENIAGIDAKLTSVKENLEYHIRADETKFKDLYERHRGHEQFQNRVKGTAKGVSLLATLAVGLLAFWQQLVSVFK